MHNITSYFLRLWSSYMQAEGYTYKYSQLNTLAFLHTSVLNTTELPVAYHESNQTVSYSPY